MSYMKYMVILLYKLNPSCKRQEFKGGYIMSGILIALGTVAVLILIFIVLGLIMGINRAKIKRETIALVGVILISVLVHVIYDMALAIKALDDLEFYVAFIGGALTLLAYKAICKLNKI